MVLIVVVAVIGWAASNTSRGGAAPTLSYDVGKPGVGAVAPDLTLPTISGGTYQLSAQRGRTVLLYFHEGLGCAPCWRQIEDLARDAGTLSALGVNDIVPISLDPVAAQRDRARLRGISLPVLADPGAGASRSYDALSYGMMGGATPGHSFLLIGPDGRILWRADYGGPPNYTMYVPEETLIAELRRVLGSANAARGGSRSMTEDSSGAGSSRTIARAS